MLSPGRAQGWHTLGWPPTRELIRLLLLLLLLLMLLLLLLLPPLLLLLLLLLLFLLLLPPKLLLLQLLLLLFLLPLPPLPAVLLGAVEHHHWEHQPADGWPWLGSWGLPWRRQGGRGGAANAGSRRRLLLQLGTLCSLSGAHRGPRQLCERKLCRRSVRSPGSAGSHRLGCDCGCHRSPAPAGLQLWCPRRQAGPTAQLWAALLQAGWLLPGKAHLAAAPLAADRGRARRGRLADACAGLRRGGLLLPAARCRMLLLGGRPCRAVASAAGNTGAGLVAQPWEHAHRAPRGPSGQASPVGVPAAGRAGAL
jgi:hypothetical protein